VLVANGNAAIWSAARQVWPEAEEQRCWNHKIMNVLDRLPKREQPEAKQQLRAVGYAPSRKEAERMRDGFRKRYHSWYPKAVATLEDDWERMVTFFSFPEAHWKHLRTTNVVESPVRIGQAADERGQTLQASREGDRIDLEAPDGRGEALQEARCTTPSPGRARRKEVHGRTARPKPPAGSAEAWISMKTSTGLMPCLGDVACTEASTSCVSAPSQLRLPPETLRVTTAAGWPARTTSWWPRHRGCGGT